MRMMRKMVHRIGRRRHARKMRMAHNMRMFERRYGGREWVFIAINGIVFVIQGVPWAIAAPELRTVIIRAYDNRFIVTMWRHIIAV